MRASTIWFGLILGICCQQAFASHIVFTTGYASSRAPETPEGVSFFADGSGWAAGARVDIDRSHFWFGPSFFFWNNITGDADQNRNSTYYQIELGGRLLYHTQEVPTFYIGGGLGYTLARGEVRERFDYAGLGGEFDFDGEFPSAAVILGIKSPSRTNGIGVLAEGAYHFGLDEPTGRLAIGPARAWTVQLGVVFDTRFAGD